LSIDDFSTFDEDNILCSSSKDINHKWLKNQVELGLRQNIFYLLHQ